MKRDGRPAALEYAVFAAAALLAGVLAWQGLKRLRGASPARSESAAAVPAPAPRADSGETLVLPDAPAERAGKRLPGVTVDAVRPRRLRRNSAVPAPAR